MKRLAALPVLICCALIVPASLAAQQGHGSHSSSAQQQQHGGAQHHAFGVRAFDRFHDVLHPLEHEALPKGDFKTIRARAAELVNLGRPITKMSVPRGASDAVMFKNKQKEFAKALANFRRDARSGTDEQLKTSYSAVHDSFEELAGMLPRG